MAASEERRFQALVLAPIRRVQRRLNAVAWAEAGIVPVWATATACVLARFLLRESFVWALPPVLAVGLGAWFWRARSRGVSLEHAAVLADRSANAGGLLLTRLERPVGAWELSVNQLASAVKLPEVNWRRPVGALAGAVLFVCVGFLLPLPSSRSRPVNAAAAAKVASVQAQAEALSQEEALEESVEDELRRLAEEVAEGRFDSGDWEAADALEHRLAEKAAEAAAQLAHASEAARALEEALSAAGGSEAATREREELERALMALDGPQAGAGGEQPEGLTPSAADGTSPQSGDAQASAQHGAQTQQGQQGAQSQHGAQAQQGPHGAQSQQGAQGDARTRARGQAAGSPDQLSDLRQALERRRQSLENRFDPNRQNGSRSQARRPNAGRDGQGRQGQGRASRGGSGEGGAEGDPRGGEGQGARGHASRGVQEGAGVSRGGGSRPLVFGDEAEMDPDRLAFEALPPGQGGDEGQELWGLKAADPKRQSGASGAGGAQGTQARGAATEGAGAAPLLPRNRDMVKRYFGGESSGRGQ